MYKSGTEETIRQIKKELKPFKDMYKSLDQIVKRIEKNQKRKTTIKKSLEQRYEPINSKTNIVKDKYVCNQCGKEVSLDTTKCPNCGKSFKEEIIATEIHCSHCHKDVKKDDIKCPHCGALFYDNQSMDNDKKELIDNLNKDLRKDNFEKLTKEELALEIKSIIDTINKNKKLMEECINHSNENKYKSYQNKVESINKKILAIEKRIENGINKSESLIEYNKILYINHEINTLHKEILGGIQAEKIVVGTEKVPKEASIIKIKEEIGENTMEEYDNYEEDEQEVQEDKDDIVYKELEDWQKKEVDEGNYDSYNFEEEELEDDDFYSEDED